MPETKRNLLQEFCGNCLYYRPYNDGRRTGGRCHHQPPERVVLESGDVGGAFPPVPSQEWCGQWQPHPDGGVNEVTPQPVVQENPPETQVLEPKIASEAPKVEDLTPQVQEQPGLEQRPLGGGTRPAAKVGPKKWHREPEPPAQGLPKELGGNG